MKKSQVLAALALAFALGLGVVAPVANTYATVVAPANQEQADKLNKELEDMIEKAQEVSGYSAYSALISATDAAEENISDAKKTAAANLYKVLTGATKVTLTDILDAKGDADTSAIDKDITIKISVNASDKENYDALMRAAVNYQAQLTTTVQGYNGLKEDDYKSKTAEQLKAMANNRNQLAAITKAITDNTYANTSVSTDITAVSNGLKGILSENDYKELTEAEEYTKLTDNNKKLDYLVSAAKGAKDYNYFVTLTTAVDKATEVSKTGTSYGIADATKVLNNLKNAIDGKGINEGTNKATTLSKENVTVTGDFEDGVILNVEKVERKVEAFGDRKAAMYNITLTKDGKAYDLKGQSVKVTIKFEGVDGSKAGVYYVNDENKADFMKGAEIKGDVATFTTTHFSVYAIVENAAGGLPNTGVISAAVEGNASTTVAMVAGIATALTAAGAGVVAYRNARRSVRK